MTAVKELNTHVSLNKSLLFIGVSKTRWYYSKSPRSKRADPVVTDIVQKIGKQRPTYLWNQTYGGPPSVKGTEQVSK